MKHDTPTEHRLSYQQIETLKQVIEGLIHYEDYFRRLSFAQKRNSFKEYATLKVDFDCMFYEGIARRGEFNISEIASLARSCSLLDNTFGQMNPNRLHPFHIFLIQSRVNLLSIVDFVASLQVADYE